MDRFKNNIENKKIKNEFDIIYKEYIDSFYERAMVALSFLNKSDYYKLSKEAQANKTLCHHSFYYQNIIKKRQRILYNRFRQHNNRFTSK